MHQQQEGQCFSQQLLQQQSAGTEQQCNSMGAAFMAQQTTALRVTRAWSQQHWQQTAALVTAATKGQRRQSRVQHTEKEHVFLQQNAV